MTATVWHAERESTVFVGPLDVLADGLVTPFEVAVVERGQRPIEADWDDPYELEDDEGVLVGPGTSYVLTPGLWSIWVRVSANPEVTVLGPNSPKPPGFVRVT